MTDVIIDTGRPPPDRSPYVRRHRDWTGIGLRIAEVVLIVALGLSLTGSDHQRAQADDRSDRLSACRALYNSDKETARTTATDALNERDKVQTEALGALARDEKALFIDITTSQLPAKIQAEDEAVAALDVATKEYVASAALAVSDPDAFLAACNARPDAQGG